VSQGVAIAEIMAFLGACEFSRPSSDAPPVRRKAVVKTALTLAPLLLMAAYCIFTGPRHLDRYPPFASSPYKLPWKSGHSWFCAQSNRGIVSHRGWEEFAYDFSMPVGTEVCAARGGIVTRVEVRNDGRGLRAPNNLIAIDHADGTVARYLHLKQNGALVRVGDRISQGQRIGLSGNVGRSLGPHLHFNVVDTATDRTIPVSFADVPKHHGIPRLGCRYTAAH
jgi:murein DD-endopeptidase MepM/ murein hydrolase activator NlpD